MLNSIDVILGDRFQFIYLFRDKFGLVYKKMLQ